MAIRVKDHPSIYERRDLWSQLVLPSQPENVNMGPVYAELELVSGDDLALVRRGLLKADQVKRMSVSALVDTGASTLCVNEMVKAQLDLPVVDQRPVQLADGSIQLFDVVGPVEIHFQNRRSTLNALVLPGETEVLLGTIPLEDMDVLIDPQKRQLVVNPASPNMATAKAKSPLPVRLRPRRGGRSEGG